MYLIQEGKVFGYPDILNRVMINKKSDTHFQIIADDYNSAFIISKINIRIIDLGDNESVLKSRQKHTQKTLLPKYRLRKA